MHTEGGIHAETPYKFVSLKKNVLQLKARVEYCRLVFANYTLLEKKQTSVLRFQLLLVSIAIDTFFKKDP